MLNEIDLAYAMTVQGPGQRASAEPWCAGGHAGSAVPDGAGVLYTALARARELLIVVGTTRPSGHGGQRPSAAAVFRHSGGWHILRIRRRDKGRQVLLPVEDRRDVSLDAGLAVMLMAGQIHPVRFGKTKRNGAVSCWTSLRSRDTRGRHPASLRIRPAVMAGVFQMETDANGFIEQACNTDPYGPIFTFSP